MIGLDTNLLLRLFVEDDPVQASRARAYFSKVTIVEPAVVNPVVLAELTWTLVKTFKLGRNRVADIIDAILASDDLKVLHSDAALDAVRAYRSGKADYADYFLSYINIEYGCTATATFDTAALTSPNFTPIP
jgi:predicted nucleic-acid-binding protein